jgi:hypothetical protein
MQRVDSDPIITNDLAAELQQLQNTDKQAVIDKLKQYNSCSNQDIKKETEIHKKRLQRSPRIGRARIDD